VEVLGDQFGSPLRERTKRPVDVEGYGHLLTE
jgi:hypothetical protein